MPALLLVSAAGLLAVLIYRDFIYPGFISPFSKVPRAHFSVPFTSLWIRWKRRKGTNATHVLLEAHKKHGPLVRLSPDELSVTSLDGLRRVYTGGFEKAQMYEEFINYGSPNLVSMLRNEPHSIQKRMISYVYSKSCLYNSADLEKLSKVILFQRIFPALQTAADDDDPFDAYGFSQGMGTDFVTAYLFGVDNSTNFIQDVTARKKFTNAWRAKKDGVDAKKSTKEMEDYVLAMCRAADVSAEPQTTKPVVYEQLSSKLSKSPVPPEKKDLVVASEMFDHIIAGIDTTTITITYLEWELSRNVELQSALRNELRALSSPLNFVAKSREEQQGLPNPKELDVLPLLDAVLKEVLRVYPPTPVLLGRVTPKDGAVVEGYAIPGGITIGTSAKCMHLNEEVFRDAESFNPKRWLNDGTEECEKRIKEMNRWLWSFGSGGRMCIGNHFAIHSMCLLYIPFHLVVGVSARHGKKT